jgi:histidinol-phosphate aminotransferase
MGHVAQTLALAALNDLPYMHEKRAPHPSHARSALPVKLRRRGWRVCDSQTNFLFVRPPDGDAGKVFEALKDAKIFVRYFPAPETREYLRITVGTDEQMDRLLARL